MGGFCRNISAADFSHSAGSPFRYRLCPAGNDRSRVLFQFGGFEAVRGQPALRRCLLVQGSFILDALGAAYRPLREPANWCSNGALRADMIENGQYHSTSMIEQLVNDWQLV